jgi:hypothetical protein
MANVHPITPHLQTLQAPTPLRALPGWLIWRFEERDGDTVKVPYYAHGGKRLGRQGDPKDKGQLVTFEAARRAAAAKGFTGVGFATLPEFGITALDFDDCVTEQGLNPDVERIVTGTYAEYSPSGQGVRAFMAGSFGANRKSHATAVQWGLEVFSTKGFVTFTGAALEITELTGCENVVAPINANIKAEYLRRFGDSTARASSDEPIGLTLDQVRECLAALDPDMDYNGWLQAGMAIHHETQGAVEGLDLWDDWSARGAKYPGRESMEGRWDGFGRSDGAYVTAGTLLKMAREAGANVAQVAAATDFAVIPEPVAPPGGHFKIRSAADFVATVRPMRWMVKALIPHATLGVMYGAPGSGKSFLAFDVCAALGRGIEWNGQRTQRGKVLYVVAEGKAGFAQRIRAYCHQHAVTADTLGIDVITDVTPNLTDSTSVTNLIADIKALGPYDLIVMDTLAQVTPGANENSGEDMGRALAYCRKIHQSSGAMVMLVHHSGKDASKGARGWSGMLAACDVELEVTRFENERCVQVTKMKDGRDGQSFGFKLHDVVLEQDEDGEDVTSCIVEYGAVAAGRGKGRKPVKMGDNERLVLSVLHDLAGLAAGGKVAQTVLLDAVKAQMTYDPTKRDQRAGRVLQAIEALQSKKMVAVGEDDNGGFVQVCADSNT